MVPIESLFAFTVASVLIELTPGPNMAWLAILTLAEGRRAGLSAVAGVSLGLAIVAGGAALGLAAAIAASPGLWAALRWAGVAFLLWLAWEGWRDADGTAPEGPIGLGHAAYFRRGLVANLLNPKAALVFVAILPGFASPALPALPQTLLLSGTYVAVATLIHAGIVVLASLARRLLVDPARVRRLRRVLALLLACVAVWFAAVTVR